MRPVDERRRETLLSGAALLLGDRWKQAAGRRFGVNGSLVRRWAAGSRPVPKWLIPTLRHELQALRQQITDWLEANESG